MSRPYNTMIKESTYFCRLDTREIRCWADNGSSMGRWWVYNRHIWWHVSCITNWIWYVVAENGLWSLQVIGILTNLNFLVWNHLIKHLILRVSYHHFRRLPCSLIPKNGRIFKGSNTVERCCRSDVCWYTTPINYRYTYHKHPIVNGLITKNLP